MGSPAETRLRLAALSSSGLADARGKRGVVDAGIRRLHGSGTFAGRAVTADCAEGSAAAMLRALAEAGEGDCLVVRGAGEAAYFGELTGAEAFRRGLAGIVVDGLVRDVDRLFELDLPLYARGTTPRGTLPEGGGSVGGPLRFGGVDVRPGDWIVGDGDGLVVVPAAEVEQAAARAEEIAATEAEAWRRVLAGGSLFEAASQYGVPLGERMKQGGDA